MGFVRADRTIDECLFYHQGRNIYIATHVDDCFISFVNDDDLAWLVTTLENKKFDISAVDELTKGLGLSFNRTESSISITQTKYIECMVNDIKVDITRLVSTPLQCVVKNCSILIHNQISRYKVYQNAAEFEMDFLRWCRLGRWLEHPKKYTRIPNPVLSRPIDLCIKTATTRDAEQQRSRILRVHRSRKRHYLGNEHFQVL